MKTFNDYIKCLAVVEERGDVNPPVAGISFDSRKAAADLIFVAIRGWKTDGHLYIPAAVEAGCKMIVCQELPAELREGVRYIRVADSSEALAKLAAEHYNHPTRELKVVGVTGTNGKTTVATLLYKLAGYLGYRAGLCSTVANYIGDTDIG
jgi:UDP-N-acetylmuramoyl-L-alanyl-D-glutamate--2,6-diaminopimelate ligase